MPAKPRKVLVNFRDVGRGRATWTARLPALPGEWPTDYTLIAEVRRRRCLASKGIDCQQDGRHGDGRPYGSVWVGGSRCVGYWTVEKEPAAVHEGPDAPPAAGADGEEGAPEPAGV